MYVRDLLASFISNRYARRFVSHGWILKQALNGLFVNKHCLVGAVGGWPDRSSGYGGLSKARHVLVLSLYYEAMNGFTFI